MKDDKIALRIEAFDAANGGGVRPWALSFAICSA